MNTQTDDSPEPAMEPRASAPPDQAIPETIEVPPPGFWSAPGALYLLIGAAAGVNLLSVWALAHSSSAFGYTAIGCAMGVGAGVGFALYAFLRPREPQQIRFDPEGVRFPSPHSRLGAGRRFAYSRIFSIARGRLGGPRLILGVRGRTAFGFALRASNAPAQYEAIRRGVEHGISRLDDGERHLEAFRQRSALATRLSQRRFNASIAVSALLVTIFAFVPGGTLAATWDTLVIAGGNAPERILGGELWRLATANFLHANLIHLAGNCLGLLMLGFLLERLLGAVRLAWILSLSALTGAITSALMSHALVSVGASTAVFGLVGAWLWMNWRYRDELPAPLWCPAWYAVLVLIVEVAYELSVPQVDAFAHIGGFVAGLGAAAIIAAPTLSAHLEPPRWPLRAAVAALAASFVTGAGFAIQGRNIETEAQIEILERLIGRQPETANALSWDIATDPDARQRSLEAAKRAMDAVVESAPMDSAYLDTLATLAHRLGDPERAVALELRALDLTYRDGEPFREHRAFFAGQICRFAMEQRRRWVTESDRRALEIPKGSWRAADHEDPSRGVELDLVFDELPVPNRRVLVIARRKGSRAPLWIDVVIPVGARKTLRLELRDEDPRAWSSVHALAVEPTTGEARKVVRRNDIDLEALGLP